MHPDEPKSVSVRLVATARGACLRPRRKRTFLVCLVRLTAAFALGGASHGFPMFVGARALQGACGALPAPSTLSLLTITFTRPDERAKAFGIYGAVVGAGGSV
ncbi:MFS transporter [Streptomyces cyaneofuscatus]|uniref:MFS transporter n=1 Tax=Streptomyces cyaneofuscatus TaxID=66883 RepID=UPI003660C852